MNNTFRVASYATLYEIIRAYINSRRYYDDYKTVYIEISIYNKAQILRATIYPSFDYKELIRMDNY